VVEVRVGVDDRRDRLGGQLADLVDERLSPARELRVDQHHAIARDERGRVAATTAENE